MNLWPEPGGWAVISESEGIVCTLRFPVVQTGADHCALRRFVAEIVAITGSDDFVWADSKEVNE